MDEPVQVFQSKFDTLHADEKYSEASAGVKMIVAAILTVLEHFQQYKQQQEENHAGGGVFSG